MLQDDAVTHPSLLNRSRSPDWQTRAACASTDVGLFFPARDGNVKAAARSALAICEVCTVATECLEWALGFPESEDFGILGGTTQGERKALRRRRQAREAGLAVHRSGSVDMSGGPRARSNLRKRRYG